MDFKIFLKSLARFSGALLLSLGLFLVIASLIAGNVAKNVDKIDDVAKVVSVKFLAENKEEIKIELSKAYEKEQLITKDEAIVACKNPGLIGEDYRDLISADFCSGVSSMSEKQVRDYITGYLIDSSISKLIETMSSEQVTDQINGAVNSYGGPIVRNLGLIIGLLAYVIGVFLVFAGSNFNLVYSAYFVSLRTAINLASTSLVLLLIRFISIDSIFSFVDWLKTLLSIEIPVPQVLLKFIITIALEWLRQSINPVLIVLLIALAPFSGLSIFLYIKKKRLSDEAKKEELNKVGKKEESKKIEKEESKK